MIYIPAGTFLSGADKHPQKLKAFYIDAAEVTNEQFGDFCRAMGCVIPSAAPELPVVHVGITLARAYAKWKNKRLPSPLEWERAARGVNGALFPWGDAEDPSHANVLSNTALSQHELMPARSFSAYPAFQMVGNAWEMVEGEVHPSPQAVANVASLLNPPATADEPWISIRGGSFNSPLTPGIVYDSGSVPERYAAIAPDIGFRCIKDP
jgi:formylglycine-generating enzyme required for sulfatase activity